jgi:hypothetical protein
MTAGKTDADDVAGASSEVEATGAALAAALGADEEGTPDAVGDEGAAADAVATTEAELLTPNVVVEVGTPLLSTSTDTD